MSSSSSSSSSSSAGAPASSIVHKKVLLMGRSGAGKTSMKSIIFANYIARDTASLSATQEVETSQVRFLGNLTLTLSDCGGQTSFMDKYLSQRDPFFRGVSVLIYVFDVESRDVPQDHSYFEASCKALHQLSPDAKIFCLVHKMDLLPEDRGEKIYKTKEGELSRLALPMKISCFKTSIWDETLFKAWSSVVHSLVPNVRALKTQLDNFCSTCGAVEVVLFERATFLVISDSSRREHEDAHRFEKISNIIKQFKLSCSKSAAQLQSMEVRNSRFTAFIDSLTQNTYVMVVVNDPTIQATTVHINIRAARKYFERFFSD
eukprot:TRINITY_DN2688_c0_g1_i1.p1 TRINITY_DN2688_c0_g1~~TRINITY_DN2688_c0_g1_i1.p1  ORF type:complete len:336 (-),score=139.06 TRINITY_DN2688_c0_g1_i1:95-1048(-)